MTPPPPLTHPHHSPIPRKQKFVNVQRTFFEISSDVSITMSRENIFLNVYSFGILNFLLKVCQNVLMETLIRNTFVNIQQTFIETLYNVFVCWCFFVLFTCVCLYINILSTVKYKHEPKVNVHITS
ncbi:unnamed protein product [Meganyctiphanes norvegica]|uniref:Uncharacterized protein n=1 Tax=Meganyctiphanes norvegica TaxID=48144 RepID=A0AAV2Q6L7_MEGNR